MPFSRRLRQKKHPELVGKPVLIGGMAIRQKEEWIIDRSLILQSVA